jgi:hypothetical protein
MSTTRSVKRRVEFGKGKDRAISVRCVDNDVARQNRSARGLARRHVRLREDVAQRDAAVLIGVAFSFVAVTVVCGNAWNVAAVTAIWSAATALELGMPY